MKLFSSRFVCVLLCVSFMVAIPSICYAETFGPQQTDIIDSGAGPTAEESVEPTESTASTESPEPTGTPEPTESMEPTADESTEPGEESAPSMAASDESPPEPIMETHTEANDETISSQSLEHAQEAMPEALGEASPLSTVEYDGYYEYAVYTAGDTEGRDYCPSCGFYGEVYYESTDPDGLLHRDHKRCNNPSCFRYHDSSLGWTKTYVQKNACIITYYFGGDSTVSIPEKLGGHTVTGVRADAFKNNTNISKVILPTGIERVEAKAFNGCTSLHSAVFTGNAPTYFESGSWKSFSGCASDFTIYYKSGTSGWATPLWNGFPCLPFEDPVVDFVTRLYSLCLNRTPDSNGLNNWANSLKNGNITGATAASGFIASDEFVNKNVSNDEYIRILYRTCLNREPDANGEELWNNQLNVGLSRYYILSCFVTSDEFTSICSNYGIERGTLSFTELIDVHANITSFVGRFYNGFRKNARKGWLGFLGK